MFCAIYAVCVNDMNCVKIVKNNETSFQKMAKVLSWQKGCGILNAVDEMKMCTDKLRNKFIEKLRRGIFWRGVYYV